MKQLSPQDIQELSMRVAKESVSFVVFEISESEFKKYITDAFEEGQIFNGAIHPSYTAAKEYYDDLDKPRGMIK